MNFRSINDLDMIIRSNLTIIPEDVELIVGIPRSGMLPATLLSVYLNLPLTDSMSLLSEESHGASTRNYRLKSSKNSTNIHDYNKILVIDDSCNTGLSINEVKQAIAQIQDCKTEVIYACVFAAPQATEFVDLYFEIVPQPRVFEWNIMNHDVIRRACFDIDGVLCVDPTDEQNDDGEKYIDFLQTTKPLWIPKFEIGALVTSRLEKYRSYTEKWLEDHGVKYQNLIMLNLATKEERIRMGAHAVFKANIYGQIPEAELFVESDPGQARHIFEATGKPVYCTMSNEFFSRDEDPFDIRKKELEEYESMITDIIDKMQVITDRMSMDDSKDDVMTILLENWDAVITDMKNMYSDEACKKLSETYAEACGYATSSENQNCKKILVSMPELCRGVIKEVSESLY